MKTEIDIDLTTDSDDDDISICSIKTDQANNNKIQQIARKMGHKRIVMMMTEHDNDNGDHDEDKDNKHKVEHIESDKYNIKEEPKLYSDGYEIESDKFINTDTNHDWMQICGKVINLENGDNAMMNISVKRKGCKVTIEQEIINNDKNTYIQQNKHRFNIKQSKQLFNEYIATEYAKDVTRRFLKNGCFLLTEA